MAITDPAEDTSTTSEQVQLPTLRELRWPVVQALRDLGGAAADAELVDHVAEVIGLTHQQRTVLIPSGQETKLKNRVNWTVHELKEVGVIHYPEPGHRALTELGMEADEERVSDLRAAFEANKSSSSKQQVDDRRRTDPPTAWLIRAGGRGESAELFIENGIAAVGFGQLPDLSEVSSRDEMAELVSRQSPEASKAKVRASAGQLWTLLSGVRRGDLVVMPRKASAQFALGTVTREYWYQHDSETLRHTVSVDWKRTDVPRTAIGEDLLRSLGHRRTIHSMKADEAWRLHQLLETGEDPGERAKDGKQPADLVTLVQQFRTETGYPTEAHLEQERLRVEWAEKLALENVASLTREDLTAYTNNAVDYGEYVNPVGGVMKWISDLDDAQYVRLLDSIRDLCWGEDELSTRIDDLLDWYGGSRGDTGTKGFAQGNVSATLAICHPDRCLPVFSQKGVWGREHMLRRMGLPKPERATFGQRVVDANDRLRHHLAPHFDDDPLAIATFLYWLREDENGPGPGVDLPDLNDLAERLLVRVESLEDIVSLLEDKGQVILYGPPGTGKTYLARELAKELAPDESCRALVQFHPSTSYEDFFEGYRPAGTGDDGSIRFKLTPGPLARIAEQAEASDRQHVMIIDEINRGNLPRVLGELLFLLEYRDEAVQTLYRSEEPFELPENLWFIGTMNTADRSIALVDAALRRRFHFVPFFPDSGPMAGLLGRWLDREGEPAWVGDLVDAVNDELKSELDGSHLLLGPSHFMKTYGSSLGEQRQQLRRIWEYNIEPFIEDQFFGNPDQIARFRFDNVMKRNGPAAESGVNASDDGDDPESTNGSEGERAAVDGDAAADNER